MVSPFTRVTTPLLAFVTALSLQLTPAASATTRARREAPRTSAAPTPTPQTPAAKWERYAFPGDEFSVELPGMPFVFHTIRCIVHGCRDKEKVRVFGHYADSVIFMVVAFDKPRQSETPDDFLTEVRGGGNYAPTSGKVTAGRFEGQEYRSATGAARLFMTKKHAYLVKAFARAGSHPSVERYLDSLTLSDKPQGREIVETAAAPPPVPLETPPNASGPGRGENTQIDAGSQPAPHTQTVDDDPRRVFNPKEVTQKAVIVYKGDPGFTEEARQNNVTGAVRLRLVLTSAGRVANLSVVKGLPDGLTERAIYAARHALFFPAQKDGRDVSQHITFEYYFNIWVE